MPGFFSAGDPLNMRRSEAGAWIGFCSFNRYFRCSAPSRLDWSFPQNTAFRSGFFYIGLLIGALLGQFVSAVVMGKPFKRRLIHRELLLALLGIALFFVITGLVAVFIPLSQ